MTFRPRTAAERLRQDGARLLNYRINYFNGKAPALANRVPDVWRGWSPDWSVIRQTPHTKTWAMSTHAAATKAHRIRYQLTAKHKSGFIVKMTVWHCRARASSEIRIVENADVLPQHQRCWTCSKPSRHP